MGNLPKCGRAAGRPFGHLTPRGYLHTCLESLCKFLEVFGSPWKSEVLYLQIMDALGIKVGRNADQYCDTEDAERVCVTEIRTHNATREGRIQRRQSRIAAEDAATVAEGVLYGPGIAD